MRVRNQVTQPTFIISRGNWLGEEEKEKKYGNLDFSISRFKDFSIAGILEEKMI